jgi:hypothetical protein
MRMHEEVLQYWVVQHCSTARAVHIRVPNRSKTGTLHHYMPFLNQFTKTKQTLNSTHKYDDHTYNGMLRKRNGAKWSEQSEEAVLWMLHNKCVSCKVGCSHVSRTFFSAYSSTPATRRWYWYRLHATASTAVSCTLTPQPVQPYFVRWYLVRSSTRMR